MNAYNQKLSVSESSGQTDAIKYRVLLIETFSTDAPENVYTKLVSHDSAFVEVLPTASDLVDRVKHHTPDVLMLSVDFLDAATLDQLIRVNECCPLPVVVFAKQHAPEVLKTVVAAGVNSYVVDNVQAHRLPTIIDLAMARFAQMLSLSTELKQTKEKLSERKLIERAKGIIMQQKHLSEDEAYTQMRKSAMNQGEPIAELARRVIAVFEMLE